MNNLLVKFYLRLHDLRSGEQGQDLIEYALMMALISLALISGINGIAKAVNPVFNNISAFARVTRRTAQCSRDSGSGGQNWF